jgi:hypothetical protein
VSGEIAEMMLDGTLCQQCGCALEDSLGDFPQTCSACSRDDTPKPTRTAKPRSSKADLPKWKAEADDDISVRFHCNHCLKHFPKEEGARDHVRNVHGAA